MKASLRLLVIAATLLAAGCQAHEPKSTAGLTDNLPMQPGPVPYSMVYQAPNIKIDKYRGIYLEPVTIYDGADAAFVDVTAQEKRAMASYIGQVFQQTLSKKYRLVSQPGPRIVVVKLTLAGLSKTRPAASAAARVSNPVSMGLTVLKTAEGKPAAFTGSVTIGGEVFDGGTKEILGGFVATESPPAFDLTSAIGTMEAARLGARQGAQQFADTLDRLTGR